MAQNGKQPSNPNTALMVLSAGGILVLALVAWALYRSLNVPPASSNFVPPIATTAPAATPAPNPLASDEQAAKRAVPRISVAELQQKLAANAITLIDVRDQASWDAGHIKGAMHVPLASTEAYLSYIPRDKPIVTYCT